jgi:hypothetical protein
MNRFHPFALTLLLAFPFAAIAQSAAPVPASAASVAPGETRQFDFLLGQWELVVHPKVSGLAALIHGAPKLLGTWKAWRAGADIEDEIRIVDGSGNPLSSNHSLRTWDAARNRWRISGRDSSKGRTSEATGQWQGGEMHLDGQFTDGDGKTLTRTRYYDISTDSFQMSQDRSSDNGQTWEEDTLIIDAKRVAATATPG